MSLPGRWDSWRGHDPRAGVLVIVIGVALAAFVTLALALAVAPAFERFDVTLSAAIRGLEAPGLELLARGMTVIGDTGPMALLTLATAFALWVRGRRTEAVVLIVAVAGGALIGHALKIGFHRVRPALEFARIDLPPTYSFPSGHALASFIYFAFVSFTLLLNERRLWRSVAGVAAALAVAAGIALSRVYLGVHYLGDIIAAWLVGSAWLAFVVLVAARWSAGTNLTEPGEARR